MEKAIDELKARIKETEHRKEYVCNGPMNGCPGDFVEEYDHRLDKMYARLATLKRRKCYLRRGV